MATGDNTVMGRIANLTSGLSKKATPLRRELERFVRIIGGVAVVEALGLTAAAIAIGYNYIYAMLIFIAIIAANVPEGLLAQITLGIFCEPEIRPIGVM